MTRTNPAKNDSPVAMGHPSPSTCSHPKPWLWINWGHTPRQLKCSHCGEVFDEEADFVRKERSDSPDQTTEGRIRSLSVPSTGRVRS